ncbi:MAG: hypothetical protein DRP66_02450 [Planctomycetota bacterium]|nr:MAG: hypothetical protein DRP66_02450 [Planctomycetota bacterium]
MVVYPAVFGKGRVICLGVLALRRNCRVRRALRRRFGCNVGDQTHTAGYSEQGWYEMRYKAAETAKILLLEGKLRNQSTE